MKATHCPVRSNLPIENFLFPWSRCTLGHIGKGDMLSAWCLWLTSLGLALARAVHSLQEPTLQCQLDSNNFNLLPHFLFLLGPPAFETSAFEIGRGGSVCVDLENHLLRGPSCSGLKAMMYMNAKPVKRKAAGRMSIMIAREMVRRTVAKRCSNMAGESCPYQNPSQSSKIKIRDSQLGKEIRNNLSFRPSEMRRITV
jgi:hypothetical protein